MKFMLDGALTLGTMDGANVKSLDWTTTSTSSVKIQSVIDLYEKSAYKSADFYEREAIKPLVDFIISDAVLAVVTRNAWLVFTRNWSTRLVHDSSWLGRLHCHKNVCWLTTKAVMHGWIKSSLTLLKQSSSHLTVRSLSTMKISGT